MKVYKWDDICLKAERTGDFSEKNNVMEEIKSVAFTLGFDLDNEDFCESFEEAVDLFLEVCPSFDRFDADGNIVLSRSLEEKLVDLETNARKLRERGLEPEMFPCRFLDEKLESNLKGLDFVSKKIYDFYEKNGNSFSFSRQKPIGFRDCKTLAKLYTDDARVNSTEGVYDLLHKALFLDRKFSEYIPAPFIFDNLVSIFEDGKRVHGKGMCLCIGHDEWFDSLFVRRTPEGWELMTGTAVYRSNEKKKEQAEKKPEKAVVRDDGWEY